MTCRNDFLPHQRPSLLYLHELSALENFNGAYEFENSLFAPLGVISVATDGEFDFFSDGVDTNPLYFEEIGGNSRIQILTGDGQSLAPGDWCMYEHRDRNQIGIATTTFRIGEFTPRVNIFDTAEIIWPSDSISVIEGEQISLFWSLNEAIQKPIEFSISSTFDSIEGESIYSDLDWMTLTEQVTIVPGEKNLSRVVATIQDTLQELSLIHI